MAAARGQALSESALLKRLVEAALLTATTPQPAMTETVEPVPFDGKITVRLRTDDLLALRDRAKARVMPTSTYVSFLIRSHLRALTPLPTPELEALKRSVAEISAIGRNLNQIARAVNQGEPAERTEQGGLASAASGAHGAARSHQGAHQREPCELAEQP